MKTTSFNVRNIFTVLLLFVAGKSICTTEVLNNTTFQGLSNWYAINTISHILAVDNSCYNDKTPPTITVNKIEDISCYDIAVKPWNYFIEVSDDCTHKSAIKVSYTDSVDQNCKGTDIYTIRKWKAVDLAGNVRIEIQELITNRVSIYNVKFPTNVDWYCPTNRPADPNETGVPTYDGNPITHYCGIQLDYKDYTSVLCGTSVYIRRHWTITDCCTKYAINHDQDIYYHDTTKPVITCLAPINWGTNVKECYTHQNLPSIQVTDLCNPQHIVIYATIDGAGYYHIGAPIILSKGQHTIEYFATDACGNTSSCKVPVHVTDGQPPILSCSAIEVCLETESVCIGPDDFVDEYWDDCNGISNVTLKIRKLEDFCGDPTDLQFKECVTICCVGSAKEILVEIQATDQAGNSVTCITEVKVTSKLPVEIECLDTLDLSCGTPIPNTPAVVNFCGDYTVQVKTVSDTRNAAGVGILIRRYIVTTSDGRKDSCETVIRIGLGTNAFGPDDLICPTATIDVEGCSIPNLNGFPGITLKDTARPCALVNVALKLDTFTNLGTPCIRVRRTWTITDARQPGLNLSCVQNININDTQKPVFTGIKDTTVIAGPNCNALIDLPPAKIIDCDTSAVITNSFNAQGANISPTVFPRGMTTIRFRAVDKCGNRDSITIKINVIDTAGFRILCQADTIVNCGTNFVPRNATIIASCTQIASNVLRSDTVRNKCSITKITFKRIITDTSGRKDSCSFMVTFRASDTLFCNQITWPKDTILTTCGKSTHPDSLGLKPIFSHTNSNCSRVTSTFKDTILVSQGAGGCTSVTRRIWTVQDTCAVPPVVCRDTQLITVTDNTNPVLKVPKDTCVLLRQNSNGCDTLLSFLGNATAMDCDPNVSIKNVVIGRTDTAGASLIRRYSLGITNVLVIARDACGNTTRDTVVVTIKDTVRPVAVCKKSNNYLSAQGVVQINARVFNGGSTDNCSTPAQLRFSWTRKLTDTILEVNCNQLKIKRATGDTVLDSVRVFPFERNFNLWVTDASGNQDTCEGNRFLAFFDTLNVCNKAASRNAALQGKITTFSGKSIPNVVLSAIGDDQLQNKSDGTGSYTMTNMKPGMYKVFAYKNDDPMNGVSTSDLIAIQKHVVGNNTFTEMGQYVAADINNDGDITSIDLLELRKLILGIYSEFPQNTSWRFFDKSLMARTEDHLALKEFENPFVETKDQVVAVQNFTGIKVGDVNNSAEPSLSSLENRSLHTRFIQLDNATIESGKMLELPVYLDVTDLDGMQASLAFKGSVILGVKSHDANALIPTNMINDKDWTNGMLRFNWIKSREISGVQKLFTIYIQSGTNNTVKQILSITNSKNWKSETYKTNGEIENIGVQFTTHGKSASVVDRMIVLQNAPNPFNQQTLVKYVIPTDGVIKWKVTDMSGRTLQNWSRFMTKGEHQQTITKQLLGAPGIYYYSIEFNGYNEVKKLVLMD